MPKREEVFGFCHYERLQKLLMFGALLRLRLRLRLWLRLRLRLRLAADGCIAAKS